MDVVIHVTYVAPTAHGVAPRTKLSRNSSFETLLKLLQFGIYLKQVFMKAMHCPNFMQNLPTASVVPSTQRLCVTDLVKIGKSGPHLHDSDSDPEKTKSQQELVDQVVQEDQVAHQDLVDLVVQEVQVAHQEPVDLVGVDLVVPQLLEPVDLQELVVDLVELQLLK